METFFSGEYECKIDAKGRVVFPARLKSSLPDNEVHKVVVCRGFEPCLTIYPYEAWKVIFQKVSALNEFNPEYRAFQRNFLRGSTEVELDANGRLLLPKSMIRYAKLAKEAVMVGVGNRIELWNVETYDDYLLGDAEQLSNMAQQFLGEDSVTQNEE